MMALDVAGLPRALFASSVATRSRLEGWDRAIRHPTGGVRRIGFLSVDSKVGTTVLAHQVLRVLAARRAGPLLAVDVAGAAGDLASCLGVTTSTTLDPARSAARTSSQARSGLPQSADGIDVVHPRISGIDVAGAWLDNVTPIARFFDVVVTDFGVRHPLIDLAGAAALCDVVCVVSCADRPDAEVAASLAVGISRLPEQPATVLALVDARGTAGQAPRAVAAHCAFPVIRLPPDRGLRAGRHPRRLIARWALHELAAAVMSTRPGSGVAP